MPWIESHTGVERHPKIIRAATALEIEPVQMSGHMHSLWHAALENQEDGDLSDWPDGMIAHLAMYRGDPAEFVRVLIENRLLSEAKLIHNWLNYAGRYVRLKYRGRPERIRDIFAKHDRAHDLTHVPTHPSTHDPTTRNPSHIKPHHTGPDPTGPDRTEPDPTERSAPALASTIVRQKDIPLDGPWPSCSVLMELWNERRPPLCPAVQKLPPSRARRCRSMIALYPEREFWETVMDEINVSDFLAGRKPSATNPGWRADFDFVVSTNKNRVENAPRIFEGVFRNPGDKHRELNDLKSWYQRKAEERDNGGAA